MDNLDDYPVQANVLSKEMKSFIEMLAPGVPKEDITIDCENSKLVVSYKLQRTLLSMESIFNNKYLKIFKNTFKLSAENGRDKISAKMNNGILEITIPRKENKSKNYIKIS